MDVSPLGLLALFEQEVTVRQQQIHRKRRHVPPETAPLALPKRSEAQTDEAARLLDRIRDLLEPEGDEHVE